MINIPHMTHNLWTPFEILSFHASLAILSSYFLMDISFEIFMFDDLL